MKKKVNWENLWDQSMIKRARELGGAEFDWVLWDLARKNARAYRRREAIVDTFVGTAAGEVRRKTWEEFFKDVNLMVFNLHDLGVRNRDIILTQVPNIIENVYARVAVSKLGAIVVPGQVELGEAETKGLLELAQPKITIVVPSYHGRDIARWHVEYQRDHPSLEYIFAVTRPGEELPEGTEPFSELINPAMRDKYGDEDLDRMRPDPFDLYEFIPTGGTTGVPKLCMHSTYTMAQMHTAVNYGARGGINHYDSLLCFGPLNGGTGTVAAVHPCLIWGAKLVLLTEFSEVDACRLTEEEKVTMWVGIPAAMVKAVKSPYFGKYDMSLLRVVLYSGMPMPVDVAEQFWEMGVRPCGQYGTSISGACVGGNVITDTKEELLYTSGKVYQGWDVKLIGPDGNEVPQGEYGEIAIWHPHFSYYRTPDLTRESFPKAEEEGYGGYEYTGDIGVFDERGNLKIVGRSKDMILRGGQNIFPKEIEDILVNHPMVQQIVIVAMPDPVLGEKACAFVVPAPGEKPTLEDLTSYLEDRKVTKFKWPERLELIDELPLSSGGKVKRNELKELIAKKLKKEGKLG